MFTFLTNLLFQEDGSEVDFSTARLDGAFLLRFLRARKFNVEKAFQLYVNYYKYRKKFAHLLTDSHPFYVQDVLDAGIFGVLNCCMTNGSYVMCVTPSCWNHETIPPNNCYKMFLLILDRLLENEEVQVHGLSVLDNMESSTWHIMYSFMWTEHIQRGALVELQDSFPIRFKGFHMLNQPWYVSMVMRIVRPFLRQKHRDRIHAHGSDFTALHQLMPPSQLPANFGGSAQELTCENLKIFFSKDLREGSVTSTTISIQSGRE